MSHSEDSGPPSSVRPHTSDLEPVKADESNEAGEFRLGPNLEIEGLAERINSKASPPATSISVSVSDDRGSADLGDTADPVFEVDRGTIVRAGTQMARPRMEDAAGRVPHSVPTRRRRRAVHPLRTLLVLALLPIVAGAASYGYLVHIWGELPHAGSGRDVVMEVPRGAGPRRLSHLLEAAQLVDRAMLFELYVRLRRATPRIRAGRYLLRDDLSPAQVLARIARLAPGGALRVTIPEGRDSVQIADILAAEGIARRDELLSAMSDRALLSALMIPGSSAEGYLFPDTYDLLPGSRAGDVIRKLKTNFDRRVSPVLAAQAASVQALSERAAIDQHGILILASLVEAEARLAVERPRVAAVFLNRLTLPTFRPRYLNSDPAVAYGCRVGEKAPSCAHYSGGPGDITRGMLEDRENSYNTYRRPGLPPGPICSPGLTAILAVLHPASGQELYFVARGDGSHAFATSLAEHNANVRRYRRR